MKILKPKFWAKKNLLAYLLLPFSYLLQVLFKIKYTLVSQQKLGLPIICVGNIYLGGTGKTPLSIEIASILRELKKKPVIVKKNYSQHQDEFLLIKNKNVDLLVNSSRSEALNEAITKNFNVAILDDGFQDKSIYKDLNILCFNEKQLIGNGMTIPSGPLREPVNSIKNCQIVLINGNINKNFETKIKKLSSKISVYYSEYLPQNLDNFKGKNLLAFAGIGNPENFFDILESENLKIHKKIPFPDHYNYSINELNNFISFAEKNNLEIVTTEKDFLRIKKYNLQKIKYLSISLKIFKKEKFIEEIKSYLW